MDSMLCIFVYCFICRSLHGMQHHWKRYYVIFKQQRYSLAFISVNQEIFISLLGKYDEG